MLSLHNTDDGIIKVIAVQGTSEMSSTLRRITLAVKTVLMAVFQTH